MSIAAQVQLNKNRNEQNKITFVKGHDPDLKISSSGRGFKMTCSCGHKLQKASGLNGSGWSYALAGAGDEYLNHLKPKERPVIMQTESVRAILADLKTQTRRVMDLQPGAGDYPVIGETFYKGCVVARWNGESEFDYYDCHCPKGKPGDRLWVKETWRLDDYNQEPKIENVIYKADMPQQVLAEVGDVIKWKSSMFMPRWASRLLLEITDIRVEQVQAISEEDAKAEGLTFRKPNFECGYEGFWGHPDWPHVEWLSSPIKAYQKGWDSINAKRGFSWQKNPFVWAISFRRVLTDA